VKNAEKVKDFVANSKWNDLSAIIFDFDATFFSGSVWNGWGKYLEIFIDKFLKGNKKYKRIVNNQTNGANMAEIMIKETGTAEIFYQYQGDVIYEIDSDDIVVVDGKLINKLSKKYKLFIVSNSHYDYLIHHLKKFKINQKCFCEIIDNKFKADDLSKTEYYLDILNKYNLKPENVLVVGDSFNSDILPALKLKMQSRLICDANETNKVINQLLK
jgi:FMN phosphatase YigB (HAD superfamily)